MDRWRVMARRDRIDPSPGIVRITAFLGCLFLGSSGLGRQSAAGAPATVPGQIHRAGDGPTHRTEGIPVLDRLGLHQVRDDQLRRTVRQCADLLRCAQTREALEALADLPRDDLDASDLSFLARLISLVDGVERFESNLRSAINQDPQRVTGVEVVLSEPVSDGETGAGRGAVVRGVKASGLQIDSTDGERVVGIEKLVPASRVALARRFHPRARDALWGAAFCLVHGLDRIFDQLLRSAAQDAGLKGAVDSLLAFDRGLHPVPQGGFVLQRGEWIPAQEVEHLTGADRVEQWLEDLRSGSPVARAAARVALRRQAEDDRDTLIETLRRSLEQRRARVADSPTWRALQKAYELREELERHRRHALDLIFDTEKYFYPFTPPACPPERARLYAAVQHEVDTRVDSVREIWGRERSKPSALLRVPVSFWKDVDELLAVRGAIHELELGRHIPSTQVETRSRWLPHGEGVISVRDLALSDQERQRLDRDKEVEAANAERRSSVPQSTWGELVITNAYRRMLGRRALILEPTLVASARAHGKWMSRTGRFTHLADESVGRTPFERMKRAGWTGLGGGENIAFNAGSPQVAHNMWLHSSGHHRNILFETHTHLGVAQVGRYWTQNFGGTSSYQGNLTGAGEGLFERD